MKASWLLKDDTKELVTNFICNMLKEAKRKCGLHPEESTLVVKEFNGVCILVTHETNMFVVYREYIRAQEGYCSAIIGPYYNAELTEAEVEHDTRCELEKEMTDDERKAAFYAHKVEFLKEILGDAVVDADEKGAAANTEGAQAWQMPE